MAVIVTFNPNIYSIYQTFYTTKQTDLIESLAWLSNDERSMGVSEEQAILIKRLAQFYFTVIELLNQEINPSWTYLDWLTQEEYDLIMMKLELDNATPDIINIPGALPSPAPAAPSIPSTTNSETITVNLIAETNTITTTITSMLTGLIILDEYNQIVAPGAGLTVTPSMVGGVLVLNVYTVDPMNDVKFIITY